ncbi:MAG: hypothetical protein AAGE52_41985, partial [Myxococcota bacterium]
HFRAGQSHYEAGRFDQAVTEFEASYAIRPHAALQHNIYLAHRDAGRLPEAAASLRRYLEEAEDIPNRELLEARLAAIEDGRAEPEPDTDPPSLAPGVAMLGAAAVLGAVAVATGVRAASEADTLEQRCPARVNCDPADRSVEDRARNLGIATDVMWPIASVVGIVGLALTIRAAKRRSSTETTLACGPGSCTVSLRGSF